MLPLKKRTASAPTEPSSARHPAAVPSRDALAEVVARVAEDAQREPRRYLEDARVPAGGE